MFVTMRVADIADSEVSEMIPELLSISPDEPPISTTVTYIVALTLAAVFLEQFPSS
jgi:hypothetical protein